jgi:hypothetical protein
MRAVRRMRLIVGAVVALAVVGGGSLAYRLVIAGPSGCPTALLQGTLVERDGTLAVAAIPGGRVVGVEWPFGYGVGTEDGTLTLTRVFMTVAREGDLVSVGGGEGGPGFRACGPVTLGLTLPPEGSPAEPGETALTVTGTAVEPCIPPPSGCGYWVTVTSPRAGTYRAPLEHRRSLESAANGDPTPLWLGRGLPAGLAPGGYDLSFEVGAFSDAATMVPLDDGSMGYRPELSPACATRLIVPADATSIMVDVTFHGSRCEVTIE